MAQASQEMKRIQRNLDRHLQMRAAMRRARRDALRHADRKGFEPAVHRAEHSCSHLCLQCGFLADEPAESCPACGRIGLVDLSFDDATDLVRDLEVKARMKSPLWIKILLGGLLVAATVWTGILIPLSPWPVLAVATLSIPAFALFLKPLSRRFRKCSASRPARWHGPIHPAARIGKPTLKASGRALALDGLTTAPFTGRPCVAYELAVRLEDELSATSTPWLLHETRAGRFAVGDVPVEAGKGALVLPLRRVEEEELAEGGSGVALLLRKRGIVSYDGDLELYEACLLEGQEAEVELHADPDIAVVSLPDVGRGKRRRGGPYR